MDKLKAATIFHTLFSQNFCQLQSHPCLVKPYPFLPYNAWSDFSHMVWMESCKWLYFLTAKFFRVMFSEDLFRSFLWGSRGGNRGHWGCNLTAEFFRNIWAVFRLEIFGQLTLTNSGYAFVKLLRNFWPMRVMFLRTGFIVSCEYQEEEVTEAIEVVTWLQSFSGKFEHYTDQNSCGN